MEISSIRTYSIVKHVLARTIAVFEENKDLYAFNHYKPVYAKVVARFTVRQWLVESKLHAL